MWLLVVISLCDCIFCFLLRGKSSLLQEGRAAFAIMHMCHSTFCRKRRNVCEPPSAESPSRGGWGKNSTRGASAAVTWSPIATMMKMRVRKPSAWQPSRAHTKEVVAWGVSSAPSFKGLMDFVFVVFKSLLVSLDPEERARIYSSDSDEGSDEDKAQRLMKAKKLDSDEVGVITCWTDRGQRDVGTGG